MLNSPKGNVTGSDITFSWWRTPNSTSYQLVIHRQSDSALIATRNLSEAQAQCLPSKLCRATVRLNNIAYFWYVRGYNSNGPIVGPRSVTWQIRVAAPSGVPSYPWQIQPRGRIGSNVHTLFQWFKSANSTHHQLLVVDVQANRNVHLSNLSNTTLNCSTRNICNRWLNLPKDRAYKWHVRAYNNVTKKWSGWSAGWFFTIGRLPTGMVDLIAPFGNIYGRTQVFKWYAYPGAVWYRLYIKKISDNSKVFDRSFSPAQLACSTGICQRSVYLPPGQLIWKVWQVRSNSTLSWSVPWRINVNPPKGTPVSPTLIAPVDVITSSNKPTFYWHKSPGVTNYRFQLDRILAPQVFFPVYNLWLSPATAQCATAPTCRKELPLFNGKYRWRLVSYNGFARLYGSWSNYANFEVKGRFGFPWNPFRGIYANIPAGLYWVERSDKSTTAVPVLFGWTRNIWSNFYFVSVTNLDTGKVVLNKYLSSKSAGCASGPPCTTTAGLPVGRYSWKVRGWHSISGLPFGPWSNTRYFELRAGIPGRVTLISPSGVIDSTGTFTGVTLRWNRDNASTHYQVYLVNTTTGQVIRNFYTTGRSTSVSLRVGTYRWVVRGYNAFTKRYGWWSIPKVFEVKDTRTVPCSTTAHAGGDTPETVTVTLGSGSGTSNFRYETYTKKDRMIVRYGGVQLLDTKCVGTNGNVNRSLPVNGSSTTATVQVIPNCDKPGQTGTSWNFTMGCPQ